MHYVKDIRYVLIKKLYYCIHDFALFNRNTVHVDGHVCPKRVMQSKWSTVVWYRYTSVQYTRKHAILWTKQRQKVKVLHFHSKLVPNEINLRALHTRTYTETTWSNKGVFNSKNLNPPFPRHFPYGTNRPFQAIQLLNHGRSLCRPLSPHDSTYSANYAQMLSPFWLLLCFILRKPSVTLKRPIMLCNCCKCCCCCNVTTTTVIGFRRSSTLTHNNTYQARLLDITSHR